MTNQASWGSASTNEAPEYQGNSILPDGTYPVFIEKVELKQSGDSGKKYINLWLKVLSGEFDGRMIFFPIYVSSDYLNHDNQKWAQQQINILKRLYMVSGITTPQSLPTPTELHQLGGANFDVKVTTEDDQNGKPQNKVVDSYPITRTQQTSSNIDNTNQPPDDQFDDVPF